MNPPRVPVLLDTDIGTNVDDALALAYLLCQPRCELLGVTTVSGQPEVRAQLVSATCQAFGRPDIPIHAGSSPALSIPQQQEEVPHASVLANWPHRDRFEADTAVDFLREAIRARPGEVTLLSIGPLTNIARLFARDPELPTLLKAHVLMGGNYQSDTCETNIRLDPPAAVTVFAAQTPAVYCIGTDVTSFCRVRPRRRERLFGPCPESPRAASVAGLALIDEMAALFLQQRPEITFNDPLAAASVFRPDLLVFNTGRVEVVRPSAGPGAITRFHNGGAPLRHHVASQVKAEAFFEHYSEVLGSDYQAA